MSTPWIVGHITNKEKGEWEGTFVGYDGYVGDVCQTMYDNYRLFYKGRMDLMVERIMRDAKTGYSGLINSMLPLPSMPSIFENSHYEYIDESRITRVLTKGSVKELFGEDISMHSFSLNPNAFRLLMGNAAPTLIFKPDGNTDNYCNQDSNVDHLGIHLLDKDSTSIHINFGDAKYHVEIPLDGSVTEFHEHYYRAIEEWEL